METHHGETGNENIGKFGRINAFLLQDIQDSRVHGLSLSSTPWCRNLWLFNRFKHERVNVKSNKKRFINNMAHIVGDIQDYSSLKQAIADFQPDIIFHLAAQPLVLESIEAPNMENKSHWNKHLIGSNKKYKEKMCDNYRYD